MNPITPSRMPEKFPERNLSDLAALIADTALAHVGFTHEQRPVVIPIAVAYRDGNILLHGSTGSRWLRQLATGVQVCAAITALDALVVARSAFESSMQFRSAVVFGACRPLGEDQKSEALDALTEALIPGRVAEIRRPTGRELAATLVLQLDIEDWTYKVSDGWSEDPEDDVAGEAWAGVLPLRTGYQAAEDAPNLRPGIARPSSVQQLLTR
jgi:nitroimidazol reductase NimA-like FMN-containing flavoprotein (pyridoxamine 5'-phosphate oxidase superfamily)